MTDLVRFDLETGGTVTVEVEEEPGVGRAARQGSVLRGAQLSLERALSDVRDAAAVALGQFQKMASQPDEVEIRFGVKLDAQAGALIAKTGMQGHFEVKLKWDRATVAGGTHATEMTPASDNKDGAGGQAT
ncbi:MAG: CU044_2847 family protein [Pseudonocardiales bacterium]